MMNPSLDTLKITSGTIFRRYRILLAACLFLYVTGSSAQSSDQHYSEPLSKVLKEVERLYGVEFQFSRGLPGDLMLENAYYRFRPEFSKTMQNVLGPFDLFMIRTGDRRYKIKKYGYYEMTLKDGREYLAFLSSRYNSLEEWEEHRTELRACFYKALQLDPLPESPGNQPIIVNRRKYKGYQVENIALETLPGLYVCGSLYRPDSGGKVKGTGKGEENQNGNENGNENGNQNGNGNRKGNEAGAGAGAVEFPVILSPNGHFENGRYNPDIQTRCAMLARMGAMVFSYDLFAYGESLLQFEADDHHRSEAQRVQVLNSIRILDYLLSRPDADPERVAITGGSGGGSQSMLITALDDRIKVSVPVVMLSGFFSGGCPCESGMPVHLCGGGTANPELAAMAAPRPQLVISDGGDWTRDVPKTEFPYLRKIYSYYGREDLVRNVHLPDEGHDYGPSKREAMYAFLAEQLGLDLSVSKNKTGKTDESGCTIEPREQLLAFGPQGGELPSGAIRNFEQLEAVFPISQTGTDAYFCQRSAEKTQLEIEDPANEMRFRIAVCDWMILKRQKPGAFDRTAEIGADGVEVDMGGLGQRPTFDNNLSDPLVREQFLEKSRELGIGISSIAMSGFYAQSFPTREGIERIVEDCINTMLLMGVHTAFLPLGVEGDLKKYPERREAIVERLKMAGRKAEAAGVVIGIETALDAAGEVALLEEVGSPAVKIYFNFQNPLEGGRDLYEELRILGKDRICQIHCTDTDGVLLENNVRLDMKHVKEVLDEMGWEGWLVIERSRDASNTRDVVGNYGANARYLKSIFQ